MLKAGETPRRLQGPTNEYVLGIRLFERVGPHETHNTDFVRPHRVAAFHKSPTPATLLTPNLSHSLRHPQNGPRPSRQSPQTPPRRLPRLHQGPQLLGGPRTTSAAR